MRTRTKIQLAIVGGSFVLHLVGWACVGLLSTQHRHDVVAISMADAKKKKKDEKKEEPLPPVEVKPVKAKVAPQPMAKAAEPPPPPPSDAPPPSSDAPPSNMNGFADLGLSLSGGTGGGGMSVPGGGGGGGGGGNQQPTPASTHHKIANLAPAGGECVADLVKAKLEHSVQPAYTQEGRQTNTEGVVQLEITIDATGHVVAVKVLQGLGHGLDEAAISAARQWTFTPATRCGRAIPTTLKPKVRFSLS